MNVRDLFNTLAGLYPGDELLLGAHGHLRVVRHGYRVGWINLRDGQYQESVEPSLHDPKRLDATVAAVATTYPFPHGDVYRVVTSVYGDEIAARRLCDAASAANISPLSLLNRGVARTIK